MTMNFNEAPIGVWWRWEDHTSSCNCEFMVEERIGDHAIMRFRKSLTCRLLFHTAAEPTQRYVILVDRNVGNVVIDPLSMELEGAYGPMPRCSECGRLRP